MNKHTPGPWRSVEDEVYGHPACFTPNIIIRPIILGRTVRVPIAKIDRFGGDKCIANARLIAAAPDLLESATALRDMIEQSEFALTKTQTQILDAVSDAIIKATGATYGDKS